MEFRTDLALERQELLTGGEHGGIKVKSWSSENARVTEIEITDKEGEISIGKPIGTYITVELPEFSHESELLDGRLSAVTETVQRLLPNGCETVLVAGLGNESITPDALGPICARQIFATRHIEGSAAEELGFEKLRPVAAVSTGVLGQTGIETAEYLKGIAQLVKPSAIITVDALASRRLSRLGRTVQLSDTGITPGAGVGNARTRIDESTLGVPVIAIGVPTVVDGATMVADLTNDEKIREKMNGDARNMMVTPREIDTVVRRAARLISMSINCALQPSLSAETFLALS